MMDLHLAELPKGPDRPQSTPKNNSYVLKHFKMLSKVKQFFFLQQSVHRFLRQWCLLTMDNTNRSYCDTMYIYTTILKFPWNNTFNHRCF